MAILLQQLQLLGVLIGAPGVDMPQGLDALGILGGMASDTPSRSWLAPECVWSGASEGGHLYIESLAALVQAILLVPVMALMLLGLQRFTARRGTSQNSNEAASDRVVGWESTAQSTTSNQLHRRESHDNAAQSLYVRLPRDLVDSTHGLRGTAQTSSSNHSRRVPGTIKHICAKSTFSESPPQPNCSHCVRGSCSTVFFTKHG